MFAPDWRPHALRLADQGVDVVVLGAGITGVGIALDAAQRGLRVLVVERGDIASGTSSRSSKLIHGGLRYLKQMQLRITRLACRERDRMLHLDPHLVRPIRFLYPAYHGDRTPGWQVDLGLWMYDQLTGRPDKHDQLSAAEAEQLAPGLSTRGLDRALVYGDAMADDARLTLAVAATAAAFGAGILTRAEVVQAVRDRRGRLSGVVLTDLESGRSHRVTAHVVVNATGVWTDVVRDRLGVTGRRLRPSRGAHVILASRRLPLAAAVTLPSPDDSRPVFLVPHPEGLLVGTTDIYHGGGLDDPRPTLGEVDYLLRAAGAAFPHQPPGRDDVVGAFAGLRPILDTFADDPSEASREEDVWEEEGLLSVAGGKLTTWRSTAQEAVDALVRLLPDEISRRLGRCATAGTSLAGLAPVDLASRLQAQARIDPGVASAMARRLGSGAWTGVRLARRARDLQPLADGLDLCAAEVRTHLAESAVLHLDDLLLRRVRLGMWEPEAALDVLPRLRPIVRRELGWTAERWRRETEAFGDALVAWTLAGAACRWTSCTSSREIRPACGWRRGDRRRHRRSKVPEESRPSSAVLGCAACRGSGSRCPWWSRRTTSGTTWDLSWSGCGPPWTRPAGPGSCSWWTTAPTTARASAWTSWRGPSPGCGCSTWRRGAASRPGSTQASATPAAPSSRSWTPISRPTPRISPSW